MPQGIVDGLEPVEVEKEHREFRAETPMFRQRGVEPFLEQVAVREPRQSVEMGQLLDPDLGVLSVGDVFVGRNPAPVRHRVVGDSDRPTVGEHKLGGKNLLARQSLGAPGRVAIGLFLDSSGCDEIVEQFFERPSAVTSRAEIRRAGRIDCSTPPADDRRHTSRGPATCCREQHQSVCSGAQESTGAERWPR